MKTKEEVEALKKNWLADPCWDIETTEGFEEYKEELLAFGKEQELIWQRRADERIETRARVVAVETGITHSAIAQEVSTFEEIEQTVKAAIRQSENIDFVAVAQARATLLLAAQVARIADLMESTVEDSEGYTFIRVGAVE